MNAFRAPFEKYSPAVDSPARPAQAAKIAPRTETCLKGDETGQTIPHPVRREKRVSVCK